MSIITVFLEDECKRALTASGIDAYLHDLLNEVGRKVATGMVEHPVGKNAIFTYCSALERRMRKAIEADPTCSGLTLVNIDITPHSIFEEGIQVRGKFELTAGPVSLRYSIQHI